MRSEAWGLSNPRAVWAQLIAGPVPASTEVQRQANREAYDRLREDLHAAHAGKWVVIANGALRSVADGLDEALRETDAREGPEPAHRYVFVVGEEDLAPAVGEPFEAPFEECAPDPPPLVGGQYEDVLEVHDGVVIRHHPGKADELALLPCCHDVRGVRDAPMEALRVHGVGAPPVRLVEGQEFLLARDVLDEFEHHGSLFHRLGA